MAPLYARTLIPGWNPQTTIALEEFLSLNKFVLSHEEVQTIRKALGIQGHRLLVELLPFAHRNSRPLVSGHSVGAVGLALDGRILIAPNLEFPELLHTGIHAEQFLVALALAEKVRGFTAIAVSSELCGSCRQVLNEVKDGRRTKILVPNWPTRSVAGLLRHPYARNRGTLLENGMHTLSLKGKHDDVVNAALEAANLSYVPRIKFPSGASIQTEDGAIFAGPFIEISGKKSSFTPFETALVALVRNNQPYESIQRVVLVEQEDVPVGLSQRRITNVLVDILAPGTEVEYVLAKMR